MSTPNPQNVELWEPVRGGFSADNDKHKRNINALEEWAQSPFVSSAKIQNLAVKTAHIDDAQITDAKISDLTADKITGGTITADLFISGSIKTSALGQRIEIDASGLRGIDAAESVVVNIPVVGQASFKGGVTATGLDVTGDATIRGAGSSIASGGKLTLQVSVGDPAVAPTLTKAWDEVTLGSSAAPSYTKRGLKWDHAGHWWSGIPGLREFAKIDPAGVATKYSANNGGSDRLCYGVVPNVVPWLYLICTNAAGDRWYLQKRPFATPNTLTHETEITSAINAGGATDVRAGGMDYDGSYLLVPTWELTHPTFGPDTVRMTVLKLNTDGSSAGKVSLGHIAVGNPTVCDILVNTGPTFGADNRWWILIREQSDGSSHVYVNHYDGTTDAADDFDTPNDRRGLGYDGANLYSIGTEKLTQHTSWIDVTTYVHVKYTWYDSGSTHESLPSPDAYIAFPKRAKLRVSGPSIVAGADRLRIYAKEAATTADPGAGNMKLQDTVSVPTDDLVSYAAAGAADPVTNTFSSAGTPAEIDAGAGFRLVADGKLVLPKFSANPGSPVEGQIYHNTTTHKTRVYDGTVWNDLW